MSDLAFCEDWGEKIAARHPEDLSPAEQAKLHQHLLECPKCARAYEAFSTLEARIRALPQAGPLPSLLPRLQHIQQDPAPSFDQSYCTFSIKAECSNTFTEILSDSIENAELAIEDMISQVLLELFGEGMVDDISLNFVPASHSKWQRYSIHIRGGFPSAQFSLTPLTQEYMLSAIQQHTSRMLRELFASVTVESIKVTAPSEKTKMDEGDIRAEFS